VMIDGKESSAPKGQECFVILDSTPFYAESGGQAGDTGRLSWDGGEASVLDTQKDGLHFVHHCKIESGELAVGRSVSTSVDASQRGAIALNHSATHLLHAALRKVLGDHVVQKGSLVNSERLRFDFAHYEGITRDQLNKIESLVNAKIRENSAVTTTLTNIATAKKMGAMALFGEKYGENVRVLVMGADNFSVELCGGTHVQRTGDIGSLVLVSEGGISSGVRRIEALTGFEAEKWNRECMQSLQSLYALFKGNRDSVIEKAGSVIERLKQADKQVEQFKAKAASIAGADLAAQAIDVSGVKVVSAQLDGLDRKGLMDAVDKLKNQLGNAVVVLASVEDEKVILISGVSKDLSKKLSAGDLMKEISAAVGGKGGGRPDMAQGGGPNVTDLQKSLEKVQNWVASKL
jgi:alanyl-tRNA synthetase